MTSPKTYDYGALEEAQNFLKQGLEFVNERASELIKDATNLQEKGWQGQSATGYNASAERLRGRLDGFAQYIEQQKQNVQSGTTNMQDTDQAGGKRMSAYS
ncbi:MULTISPECIES: WXG100 family type VII secretion target [Saccharopolyspora]|uniref:ESAT-6-like protein n=1 Tax=Saccharopolyspora gregorii TaxID=33914 RepID=A0ABP6RXN0_9PSEU|nr:MULTISPECIES: WXG100 family type VII secretion target [unclassified Saccharopolyspora]MCA1188179.1 WXG100 family type VII secretion target [Saccharopolyspora sp. 6T]MCA1191278.1 WXG100 family type VII secretion target [Saccharopolyspora sp. 6V]MCA1227042.1 WXG100 family type VII secretion target [Saccharopolyspora sp. 6M]MCA1282372.1 WXG100 family type VII secretion target [Saccharopolyspora sp. 7B]